MTQKRHSSVVFDGGRGGIGGYIYSGYSTIGTCVLCGKKRAVSRTAWHRKCRPMCACGGALEPSKTAQSEHADLSCSTVYRPERRCAYCRCKLRSGNMGVVCGCTTCQAALASLEVYTGLRDIADVRAESWRYTSTIDWDFCGAVYFRCGNPKRYRISYHTSAVATA